MPHTLSRFRAREILDSRGNPTLAVTCELADGSRHEAQIPSGASTGSREACELRDRDRSRYGGKGVLQAVRHVNDVLSPEIVSAQPDSQGAIDRLLIEIDGTPDKSRLGANALLGCSMAYARARAHLGQLPLYASLSASSDPPARLPVPFLNIWNGGVHTLWQGSDFQEYLIAPIGAPSFAEALRWGAEIYHVLRMDLKEKGLHTAVGDEGGFAPRARSNREPLEMLIRSIERAGYRPGEDVALAIDLAASEFCSNRVYTLHSEGKTLDSDAMVEFCVNLVRDFPVLCSIEDPLSESDATAWKHLTAQVGKRIQIIGDDIFCTNPKLLEEGIQRQLANSILIKLNQIGTVTETFSTIAIAQQAGWRTMISHRSGETPDSFIADLAVASGSGQIKSGAPARGERVAKYNRLMEIESALGVHATYAGSGMKEHATPVTVTGRV
ncbi:phosphopyruvate hydratase [mine drainage metagenome]|uniref:phosphopyruvate hydratase n=3 Tax=mine drainage metagenome TaxID=410659 RepID=T1D4B5_9ZZZZ